MCIIAINMQRHSIIAYATKLKKPIQIPALFFAKLSVLNKMLVNQRNDPLCLPVSIPLFNKSALAA